MYKCDMIAGGGMRKVHEKDAGLSKEKGTRVVSSSRNSIISDDLVRRAVKYRGQ